MGSEWSLSLMSAYYPVVLTGASLIVCFWAEVFHLTEVRWDRPRFLSKSILGFVIFNVITYSLLLTELFLVYIEHEDREFYSHIFNGCYAGLMFVVVIFFLIYGVEVFFKVNNSILVIYLSVVWANDCFYKEDYYFCPLSHGFVTSWFSVYRSGVDLPCLGSQGWYRIVLQCTIVRGQHHF